MAKFIDAQGHTQDVPLTFEVYRDAKKEGMSVEAYLNREYPTAEGQPSAFRQMCASAGLFVSEDAKHGIRPTKLRDVLDGTGPCAASGAGNGPNVRNATPTSAILYQAAILSTIEDKLARDLDETSNVFDQMVAVRDNIQGTDFKRAILNYDNPEAARMQGIAQLAAPANMITLTTSDRTMTIPTRSLGIQWSDQAMDNVGLDIIALSVARQVAIQRNQDANDALISMINGDADYGMAAFTSASTNWYKSGTFNNDRKDTNSDPVLDQTAWVKWLYQGKQFRRIDWVVTDIDTALLIENRVDKPTVGTDNPTSPRIDSLMGVANFVIPANVKVFVTDHANWTPGVIMGLDSRYAIQRVNSLTSDYNATQKDVITRSNTMRWDSGSAALRLYDGAFSILEIADS